MVVNVEDRTDHLGQVFDSKKEMCEYWDINVPTYIHRIKVGWSKEEALTTKKLLFNIVPIEDRTDHLGQVFDSKKEMCDYWDIDVSTYIRRIKDSWSKEEALTYRNKSIVPIEDRTDHLGQVFDSKKEMCDYWKIPIVNYDKRLKNGYDKEQALTTQIKTVSVEKYTDHLGQVFDSVNQMCIYWKVPVATYNGRIKAGWSKENALTTISKDTTLKNIDYKIDHIGQVFDSINQMCKKYNIEKGTFYQRMIKGYSKEESLGIIPLLSKQIKNVQFTNDLLIVQYVYSSKNIRYFECKFKDNKNEILSIDDILYIWRNSSKGGD